MRRALALLLLALAGCTWEGNAFYAASEAETVLAAGHYRSEPVGGPPSHPVVLRVSILPDGLTQIESEEGGGGARFGFAPLDAEGRFHVFWVASTDKQTPGTGETLYGLIERRADGHYFVALPNCDRDRAVAVAAGAVLTAEGILAVCRFPNRAALEAAMREFARHPGEGVELVPIR